MNLQSTIYLAGHEGLLGSAVYALLKQKKFKNILIAHKKELDLTNQADVFAFFKKHQPEYVIHAAGKVGSIQANIKEPAEYLHENMMMASNVIWGAHQYGVKKLLYVSCSCAYPTHAKQPLKEEYILTGSPEPTNEGLTMAKISGIKYCQAISKEYGKNFISCIPANTYGPNDHYDNLRSHVISALIKRFHEAKKTNAKEVVLWGTGVAKREFIYVEDLAAAVLFLMDNYDNSAVINIGGTDEVSIKDLAEMIRKIVGYNGQIRYDTTKPDGMLRRVLDSQKLQKLGFKPKTSLKDGLREAYADYVKRFHS